LDPSLAPLAAPQAWPLIREAYQLRISEKLHLRRKAAGPRALDEYRQAPFPFVATLASPADFGGNEGFDCLLIRRRKQRDHARLIIKRDLRFAARVSSHFGENCSSAEHQPIAGNFHARTNVPVPRAGPFLQNLLPRLR
jgi:hypothetical protein